MISNKNSFRIEVHSSKFILCRGKHRINDIQCSQRKDDKLLPKIVFHVLKLMVKVRTDGCLDRLTEEHLLFMSCRSFLRRFCGVFTSLQN